jgi:hypothetical protein
MPVFGSADSVDGLNHIALRVTTCIILHNILVSDRVMGEVGVVYNLWHCVWKNSKMQLILCNSQRISKQYKLEMDDGGCVHDCGESAS